MELTLSNSFEINLSGGWNYEPCINTPMFASFKLNFSNDKLELDLSIIDTNKIGDFSHKDGKNFIIKIGVEDLTTQEAIFIDNVFYIMSMVQ